MGFGTSKATVPSEGKATNLFMNIMNDFGGPLIIIKALENILHLISKLSSNKRYQKIISGLQMTLPAAIVGYKMYLSLPVL